MGPIIRNVIRDVIRPVMGDQALVSRFSPAARDYFARLDAAGLRVTTYDAANARLIDRLVANGGNFWPDSGAFCAMAGYLFPSGGTLIPLHPNHDAGTLFNFVTGDWNAVTGNKGDGVAKYVNSNRANDADGQNDAFRGVYVETIGSGTISSYFGGGDSAGRDGLILRTANGDFITQSRRGGDQLNGSNTDDGLIAISRALSTEYLFYSNGTSSTTSSTSNAASSTKINIFSRRTDLGANDQFSDPRIPFYGLGPNLSGAGELAELDSILTDWQTDLANA